MAGVRSWKHRWGSVLLVPVLVASLLAISSSGAGAAPGALVVFDDMEHGNPFGNGWFAFNGSVGGGGIGANGDVPPVDGGSVSLGTGWGSGGTTPGFFGGFGRTNLIDLSGTDHFNFWINPDAGQDYTLEINLQEDDTGDDLFAGAFDDEFRFNCVVSPTGPCAVAGGGWQQISIPVVDFFDNNSGGNGILDAAPAPGGNGQLVNIVVVVVSNSGADATFRTDYWAFSNGPLMPVPTQLVDGFESGVAPGTACPAAPPLGFCFFKDSTTGDPSIVTTGTPPEPVPGSATGNNVLALGQNVDAFAGLIRGFAAGEPAAPSPQDWSGFTGVRFWLRGQNTGTTAFFDILDNRDESSAADTAERWTVELTDGFTGWQLFELPFASFTRKDVIEGAPNDGLGLTEVHGWAFGTGNTGGPVTYYIDDVELYGAPVIPPLTVGFSSAEFEIIEGQEGSITVELNRPIGADTDDPDQVTVDYAVETIVPEADKDYVAPLPSGTLTFDAANDQRTISITTIDDEKYEPTERLILRLSDPVGADFGEVRQAAASIIDNELFDPLLIDDFEGYPYLWDASDNVTLANPELASGDATAVPGQGDFEGALHAIVIGPDIEVEGRVCNLGKGEVPVILYTTDDFDATSVDHTTVRLGNASEVHVNKRTGEARRHEEDVDEDGDIDLVLHFRFAETGLPCDPTVVPLSGQTFDGDPITGDLGRDFAIGQDWSDAKAMSFWYYGQNTGDQVTVSLKDNRASDPGPDGWSLVWADDFAGTAGTPPNSDYWDYEIGDGVVNGIPGWGNDERQYYTDDPANVAMDGDGNLVITAREADGSLECYYGPCDYTSARLVTKNRAEFAYGRVESRVLVPDGEAGLWPAFWSLGTDIDLVDWPQTGEIDVMEYVSRIPNEIFGTIHGPGYSGGESFGNTYDFDGPVAGEEGETYHTFAIEWEPDLIKWYVDDILYHMATPADVNGPWVFNDPVYFLLNLAIGGNFGGDLAPDLAFPQSMKVDYVRVYQGPDTAERFAAAFVDDFEGWQQVEIPFTDFVRSLEQQAGAPDDGLGLDEVWGYGFMLPGGGEVLIDQVRLVQPPGAATVIDDFEDGSSSDWLFFGGNGAGGGGGAADDGAKEGASYFNTGWGGNGTASGFYGGAFKNFPNPLRVRPPADPWFNVWVRNERATSVDQYRLEITIREDLDGNGWGGLGGVEESFRLDTEYTEYTEFNDEWVLLSAPLGDFALVDGLEGDGKFNGDLDEIVIVIAGVEGARGSVVELDFDYFAFTSGGPLIP